MYKGYGQMSFVGGCFYLCCMLKIIWIILLVALHSCNGSADQKGIDADNMITLVTTSEGVTMKGKVVENEDGFIILETLELGRVEMRKDQIMSIRQMRYGTMKDARDNRIYPWVEAAGLKWHTMNLRFELEGSFCALDDCETEENYGRLYTWPTACKVCPEGWRLPTDEEWQKLEMELGMDQAKTKKRGYRGAGEAEMLKADGNSGLVFPYAGARYGKGDYRGAGDFAYIWTSSSYLDGYAWARAIYRGKSHVNRNYYDKDIAFSVRCVSDL